MWPYSTAVTITAMGNILQSKRFNASAHGKYVSTRIFYDILLQYARSHRRNVGKDKILSWIDEK